MTHERPSTKKFRLQSFPALQELLPAYLHEDFNEEYGSATKAFEEMLSDSDPTQTRHILQEWKELRSVFSGHPISEIQSALVTLGGAWHPQSEQDLQAVDEILSRAEP